MSITEITDNVRAVRGKIAEAAIAAGRDPGDVLLVAATKMNDADRVREAIAAGVDVCGENRVQEMLEKNAQGAYLGAPLHFIGHLQKNKVKQVVGLAELIHSVDSTALMDVISAAALAKGTVQDILLEMNVGGEASKSGFSPDEIASALAHGACLEGIRVRGLMAIPPICRLGEENRPYFQLMQKLFIDNSEKKYDNVSMCFLSMGMSGDYETAVECGANMVRLGSAIFGARIYPAKENRN